MGYCLQAAEQLEKEGISAEVVNLRTLRPLDRHAIIGAPSLAACGGEAAYLILKSHHISDRIGCLGIGNERRNDQDRPDHDG